MATKTTDKLNKTESFRDSEGKLIQNLPEHIKHGDLEYLEIIGNPELFYRAVHYLMDVLPDLQTSFNDFIELIGLSISKYSDELNYQAGVWRLANEVERNEFQKNPLITPEKILIFEEIIQADKEKGAKLLELIFRLAQLWGKKDINNKPSKLTMEAFDIIAEAIYPNSPKYPDNKEKGLSLLKASDYTIAGEVFMGIIFKPEDSWNKCFFLRRATASLTKILQ